MFSLQSNVVSVSNSSAAGHFLRRSFALTFDLLKFPNYWLDLFRQQFLFPKLFRIAKSPQKLTQFALMMSHHCLFYKMIWLFYDMWFEYDFHDSDKMPKHVEMVRTQCQPESWDGQNANHRKKSGQNANLWLALCPVGILSGWHFVLPPNFL